MWGVSFTVVFHECRNSYSKTQKFSTSNIIGHHYTSSQFIYIRCPHMRFLCSRFHHKIWLEFFCPMSVTCWTVNNGPSQSSRNKLLKQNYVCAGHLRAESVPVWTNWTQNKKSRMVMTKWNLRMPQKWTPKVMEAVNSSMHEDTIAIYNKAFELTAVKWFNFEDDCTWF